MLFSFDWDQVQNWQNMTHDIPRIVREDIMKSRRLREDPEHALKANLTDPLSLQYALGYKDRRHSLSYDILKRIPGQLSIIGAILQTRCNQVASFCQPYRREGSIGYIIQHKDPTHETTKSEAEFIKMLEEFIYRCGRPDKNPHTQLDYRDDFETFLKKIVRDSLMYDQLCFEVVPDRKGLPYEFVAVDASTIRIASNPEDFMADQTKLMNHQPQFLRQDHHPYKTLSLLSRKHLQLKAGEIPAFIQLTNGQIDNVFTSEEMAFGVRNPRTDIYIQGYGYGELEQLLTIITAHLNAEEYNRRFFTQGSAPKGILNFKGDNLSPEQLENIQRQWRMNVEGVHNAWRTPIFQSEQGVDWVPLSQSNREMEYGQWMEYLVKITCAVFLIDPSEVNFDMHGGVQQTPLFEASQEWKLKASRDRGLKPLLRFIARMINKHIIEPIDDAYTFSFVGLDELTEQEKHELRKEEVSSYKTLNEVRIKENLPAIKGGDFPMNPAFFQAQQLLMQQEQQAQMMQQQQAAAQATPPPGQGAPPAPQGQQPQQAAQQQPPPPEPPSYADSFQKSVKFLEINLDDLDGWKRR